MSATLSPDGIADRLRLGSRGQPADLPDAGQRRATPRRLTFQGGNNTTPRWSPARRQAADRLHRPGRDAASSTSSSTTCKSKNIERVTQGQGSNQSPDWSPDGRLLVYASSRGRAVRHEPGDPQGGADLPGPGQLPHLGTGARSREARRRVDVGTNTTLLLVAEGDRARATCSVLADRAEITRLGRGIGGDGRLGAEGIARTLAVLAEYAAAARAPRRARCVAVGTEALRRAPNAARLPGPGRRASWARRSRSSTASARRS